MAVTYFNNVTHFNKAVCFTKVASFPKDLRILRTFSVWILLFFFAGCATYPQQLSLPVHTESLLYKDIYTVDIPSFDGETIRATIYQPRLKPGETAPLVLHSHGFGMFRMKAPLSLYGKLIFSGVAAQKAWDNGYWMISFDHRGHGGSGGRINLMDPTVEVLDLTWLLDWVEDNLPRVTYRDGDPVVGMVGESYGGGLQLLAASVDERIDAIVPITTWYDFSSVLTPNSVVKSGWLTTLVVAGNVMNPLSMNKDLTSSYFHSLISDIPSHFAPMMESRSLSNSCYCLADATPHADAFFIQGFRDVLFPLNEAVANLECLEFSDRDVRLLGTQNGHLLPMTQFTMGLPGYDVDTHVTCDDARHRTDDLVLAWFDEKLKGQEQAADIIPKVCLTHDQNSGSTYDEVPVGGQEFSFERATVGSGFTGLFELPLTLVDLLGSSLTFKTHEPRSPVTDEARNDQTNLLRPIFVPLKNINQPEVLAGIPIADFTLTGDEGDIIFAGLGVRRNGAVGIEIISDQIYPFRGGSNYRIPLPGVSTRLQPGDTLGLVFSGYSNQYRLSSRLISRATISGKVELPLVAEDWTIAEE